MCNFILLIGNQDWKGRGAKVPFEEVEAEHSHHNGKEIGNNRTFGTLSSEASGRRAVQLSSPGEYVEFTMPIRANSIVVRYSIPDSSDGKGIDTNIDLIVNGQKIKDLPLTSRFSWYYGSEPPFTNDPKDGNPSHFYDEVRTLFDKTYHAGTKVRVQVGSNCTSPTYTIDLADFELVGPPHKAPENSISVLDYGADPSGTQDSTKAFQKAFHHGQVYYKIVFIPEGHYFLTDHVVVDYVTITGAGPWYTVLSGRHPTDPTKSAGIYGKYDTGNGIGSRNVHLSNFAIIGSITERVDDVQANGIGGSLTDSTIDNLWIQHTKCGAWFDGKMNGLVMRNSRIMDTAAHGIGFHMGVINSKVENCFIRNTGDEGLSMWAEHYKQTNNQFKGNTVAIPLMANNIAIYGGRNIEVSQNLIYDTVTNGGGIHIGNRNFGVDGDTAIHTPIKINQNTLLRTGAFDFNWEFGIGAIWFSGENEKIEARIEVKDCDIIDSSYPAISFVKGNVTSVVFTNLFVNGTGTFFLQIQDNGEATFNKVRAYNIRQNITIFNCEESFKIKNDGKGEGWFTDKPMCSNVCEFQAQWPWNW